MKQKRNGIKHASTMKAFSMKLTTGNGRLPANVSQDEGECTLIEAGEYEAQCIKYKEFRQFGGLPKLCLGWDFTLSGKEGLRLPQFINMAYNKFKMTTFYYRNWVIANNNMKPLRPTRQYMLPKIFLNITAIVVVETVEPLFPDGAKMPEPFHYSKVSFIKRLTTINNCMETKL